MQLMKRVFVWVRVWIKVAKRQNVETYGALPCRLSYAPVAVLLILESRPPRAWYGVFRVVENCLLGYDTNEWYRVRIRAVGGVQFGRCDDDISQASKDSGIPEAPGSRAPSPGLAFIIHNSHNPSGRVRDRWSGPITCC